MPTSSIDVVHMDGRRVRFQRQDGAVTVHTLGATSTRSLDVDAARRLFQQLEAHGFSPVDEAAAANVAAVFGDTASAPSHLGSVIIVAQDLAAQVRFYQDTLGLPLRHRSAERAVFGTEGATLEVVAVSAVGGLGQDRPGVVLALHGQQARRLRLRLPTQDVTLPPAPGGATNKPSGDGDSDHEAAFADPEGNVWLLRMTD